MTYLACTEVARRWQTGTHCVVCIYMTSSEREGKKKSALFYSVVKSLVSVLGAPFHRGCLFSDTWNCSNIYLLCFTGERRQKVHNFPANYVKALCLYAAPLSCRTQFVFAYYGIVAACNGTCVQGLCPPVEHKMLKQTSLSVKPSHESIQHPVSVNTACQYDSSPTNCLLGGRVTASHLKWLSGLQRSERTPPRVISAHRPWWT